MSQLASLLSIAQIQSERQFEILQKKERFIAHLTQQRVELIEYSRVYQQSAEGTDTSLSTLLVHRQRFKSQLACQIDGLTSRISKLSVDAEDSATQWRYFEARRKAIESLHETEISQKNYLKETIAQRNSDELGCLISARRPNLKLLLGTDNA